jgi:hypothetical protein
VNYQISSPVSAVSVVRANRPPAPVAQAYAAKQHVAIKGFMRAFGYAANTTSATDGSTQDRIASYLGLGYGCV